MAFRPNYNQQRADRDRAKAQKKKDRLARREEESQKRKAGTPDGAADASPATDDSRESE